MRLGISALFALNLLVAAKTSDPPCSPCKQNVPKDATGSDVDRNTTNSCNCESLNVSDPISSIQSMMPPVSSKAMDLYLDKNKFDEIDEEFFKTHNWHDITVVKHVRTLTMRHCNIKTISSKAFLFLTSLQVVYLDNNELETLPEGLFDAQNVGISRLYLTNNKIHSVADTFFKSLTNLADLRMSENLIGSLHKDSFKHNSNLHSLYLTNNKLTQLKYDWFTTFRQTWQNGREPQKPQVFLTGNPWICDCTITEVVDFIKEHKIWIDHYDKSTGYIQLGTCQYPRKLSGTHFFQLRNEELVCETPSFVELPGPRHNVLVNDDFLVKVTTMGRPNPIVNWEMTYRPNATSELGNPINVEGTVEYNANDTADSLSVTHVLKPSFNIAGVYSIVVSASGMNYKSVDEIITETFEITVTNKSNGLKISMIIIIVLVSLLIIWRYRSNLCDTWSSIRGRRNGMPNYAYANLPSDQSTLLSSEELPESDMRINV